MENDLTAKIFGEILAEGMSLAECDLTDKIESEALGKLKEIKEVVESEDDEADKLKKVERILEE